MKKIVFCVGLILTMLQSRGQVVADFSLPATACLNQVLQSQNNSSNATSYFWDFNQGDLSLTPTLQNISNTGGNIPIGLDIVSDGVNWFGFIASQEDNSIIRLDYGNSLTNTPSRVALSGLLGTTRPKDVKIIYDNNQWYGFVYGLNQVLTRLDFGTSLTNTSPGAVQVISGIGIGEGGIDIQYKSGNYYIGYTHGSAVGMIRLTSVESIPGVADQQITTIGGGSWSLGDIKLQVESEQWYAYVASYSGTKQIVRLQFGSDPLSSPTSVPLSIPSLGVSTPYGLDVAIDNGEHLLFISTSEGNVVRANLGSNLSSSPLSDTNLGNFGNALSNTLKMCVRKQQSSWFLFSVSWSASALYKISFPNPAVVTTVATSMLEEPIFNYTAAGTHYVSLTAQTGGAIHERHQAIIVQNKQAPEVNFASVGACEAHDILFTPQVNEPITNYVWAFGDGGTSFQGNAVHQYATAGDYNAKLTVTAANGCENTIVKPVTVFNIPVANFTEPAPTVTCTNQFYTFNNTSVYDVASLPTWQWQVEGENSVTTEDGSILFPEVDAYQVKLIVSIPGCSSETTKNYTVSEDGPTVDFTTVGECQNTPITFTSNTTGQVSSLLWNFGDGTTSPDGETTHSFSAIGEYNVELAVSNTAGCNNTVTKPLTIYSQPQVSFTTLAPPFSCSATATHFSNSTANPTDSNISGWAWNFGDAGSSQNTSGIRNPQHTYEDAGEYSVTLKATTNFSCSATLQKTITIAQSPLADFTHAALCEDSPVSFSDAASTNKAWTWQIGSSFYTTENPQHTFTNPGAYNVTLSVTGVNNCIGSATRAVIIPQKLAVDFTTIKTCLLQDTEFTNITNDASDAITGINWNFGSAGTSTNDPAIVSFLTSGTVNVSLSTTTQSGCVYTITKPILITDGPVAAFTATPNTGEAPLKIQFTNTSINANSYQWQFHDEGNQTSTQPSPIFTYSAEGFYTTELTALDAQGCMHTTQQLINVTKPTEVRSPYPNPGRGNINIEWKTEAGALATLALVDGVGRVVQSDQIVSVAGVNRFTLDVANRPSGLYILTLNYLGTTQSFRLIVRQ